MEKETKASSASKQILAKVNVVQKTEIASIKKVFAEEKQKLKKDQTERINSLKLEHNKQLEEMVQSFFHSLEGKDKTSKKASVKV